MQEFPIFNTKQLSDDNIYDLNDVAGRRQYFAAKLGTKIEDIKSYLDTNSFVGFMLAKKSAGKGTYAKLFEEIVGPERIAHVSVGDIVRDIHATLHNADIKSEVMEYMKKYYRSFMPLEDALKAFIEKSQDKLIPTEFILTLVKMHIEKIGKKAVFIDGLPRSMDQISYSLYFRDLINFRDDPDFFVLIDIPESVIDARMKGRVVCPLCKNSRNIAVLPTKFVKYDNDTEVFYLCCDNSNCSGFGNERMITKEGDDKGIEFIRDRLTMDGQLIEKVSELVGVPKILLRNSVPVTVKNDYVEDYEITPGYRYTLEKDGTVTTHEELWVVKDDRGVDSHSLLAPAVVVGFISQLHDILFPKS